MSEQKEVILMDGDEIVTWGKYDTAENCLLYSWFGARELEEDMCKMFKYWIHRPTTDVFTSDYEENDIPEQV